MDREPSASGLTVVSKKGMEPSLLIVLYCKRYGRVNTVDVMCSLWMTKVSSTYLCQNLGGWGAVLRDFCSKYSMYRLATMGLTGEPMAAPSTCL